MNLPPESPLSGRSDKLVRDPFETKEPVNKVQISKGCLNEVIIMYLQEVIKRPLRVIYL